MNKLKFKYKKYLTVKKHTKQCFNVRPQGICRKKKHKKIHMPMLN